MRSLLVNLIFFILTRAENLIHENVTHEDISSARLKRAPFHATNLPDSLKAILIDDEEEIHIEWQRVERYLANENLPVYTAHINSWGPNHKLSDAMKKIGKLVFYHSTTHDSNLVLAPSVNKISGVIDDRYIIIGVSIDQLSLPLQVGGPYVKRVQPSPTYAPIQCAKDPPVRPRSYSIQKREINSKQIDKNNLRIRRDVTPERVYIETLVFVTYDIYLFFKNLFSGVFFLELITNYIFHFNCVDMIYADLAEDGFEIFINLAGIIVEAEEGVFSKITKNPDLEYNNQQVLHTDNIIKEFEKYPDHFDFPFTRDSFDFIFLLTGRQLVNRRGSIHGAFMDRDDIFESRKNNYGRSFVPMSILRITDPYSSYTTTAHHIGRAIGIDRYNIINGEKFQVPYESYGTMQASPYYNSHYIEWSYESVNHMIRFMRENRNRCFLFNKPRSLHPSGTPIRSLSPCRQCQCFGYGCRKKKDPNFCLLNLPYDDCMEPLQCSEHKSSSKLVSTILPFDGTPCGKNKVCWNEKCTGIK